ncbi:MAG TPA: methionyl-tRNA formyltransferase [Candidatus Saccharibacteria bacterium]|nr:methionyl-tRNA formyltransferase [Candidatus Saccharibacteria bacterium]
MPNSGTKPSIVFFGNERLATGVVTNLPILTMLLEEGYKVAAIVASDSGTASRKQRTLEVEEFAKSHDIPYFSPKKLADIYDNLQALRAEAGILAAYGKMVPESVISLFPQGIINIHPSALPQHRGPIPLEAVMLDGSSETAVSLMALVRSMDAGPVYAQAPVELVGNETKQALAETIGDIGSSMLRSMLPKIFSGECVAQPQDDAVATYDTRITKADGVLNFTKPAVQLEREVRAYAGWPGICTTIAGKDVVITAAHITKTEGLLDTPGSAYITNKQLYIQTSNNALIIDKLKPAGKNEMSAAAFIAGYGKNIKTK